MNPLSYWCELHHGVLSQKHVIWRAVVVLLRMDSPVVCQYRLMDCRRVFYFGDLKMHHVTESQSNYTSHEIQNLCLFFLNLIRDKDRRFSERLSCEASRSSLTIDSVRDASETTFVWTGRGTWFCRGWQKIISVFVPNVQTAEQLLPAGWETEDSLNHIQQEGFSFHAYTFICFFL